MINDVALAGLVESFNYQVTNYFLEKYLLYHHPTDILGERANRYILDAIVISGMIYTNYLPQSAPREMGQTLYDFYMLSTSLLNLSSECTNPDWASLFTLNDLLEEVYTVSTAHFRST